MSIITMAALITMAFGAMAILDEILAKSYKDGVKRGIEIGEYEKTIYTTTNVED